MNKEDILKLLEFYLESDIFSYETKNILLNNLLGNVK